MDALQLEKQIKHYWALYRQQKITKGDFVSLYLLSCHVLFPTPNWLCWSSQRRLTDRPIQSNFYPQQHDQWASHLFFKKIPAHLSLGAIMNQSVFKKETLRSNLGLMHLYTQPDTVQILDYIPTPAELLQLQSQGFRCVTLLEDRQWFEHTFDHKRNLRDFVIHDLEHIWQMFENPVLTSAQICFSSKLLELTQSGHFDFLRHNSQFKNEFDYIISDMNTHPAHTYATLKSLVMRTKHFENYRLSPSEETEIKRIMQPFDELLVIS